MKRIFMSIIALLLVIISQNLLAQQNETTKASKYGIIDEPIIVPSIASQVLNGTFIGVDQNEAPKDGPPKRRGANKHVPGKGLPHGDDPLVNTGGSRAQHRGKEPMLVFDANISSSTPSDPTGAVGPNHFVGAWNTGFRIFDKDGNPLTDEASLSTLFPGNDAGDPIVFYDAQADRFVITEFDFSPEGFNMAICMGPDPVNDGWYVYTTGFEPGAFPDYTKFSVWSDGYYVTANISNIDKVFVVERDEMLLGNPSQFVTFPLPGITTSGFYSPQFFNIINDDLPPAGNASVVYMQDDAWAGVSEDHLKVWTVNVDWDDIANSTISNPQEIITTPFTSVFDGGSFSNVPQPSGPDQDVLQATIMNQAQFRKFPGYNSAIFNFVVDTEGPGSELAGIRWYELRQTTDGDPWTIYQEGTYVSPVADRNAFSGSMVMDGHGNIGMGYTTCSATDKIAIYYTGRYGADPLGEMTIDETLIAQGTSNNPSNRLADYVQLSLDPTNDKTFWHIAEYFISNQRTDVVGVFQIASDYSNDVGVMSIEAPVSGALTDAESVTVTVFNYGEETQSNIPVSYMVDAGNLVSEVVPVPITTGASEMYTFTATANLSNVGQTYTITAYTDLSTDEFRENDTASVNVFHMYPNDIGVIGVVEPISGNDLTSEEEITVSIENFGTSDQSDFEVSYNLDNVVVTEQVAGPLLSNDKMSYTFSTPGDFTEIGDHLLTSYTSLPDDADRFNDTTSVVITKNMCQPESDCSAGDGIYLFELRTIINPSECSPNGYGDYTYLMTELEINSTNDLTIETHYANQYVRVWIDFNDNFMFEIDELVVDNYIIEDNPNAGSGVFIETMPLVIPAGANLGQHMMRAKTNWNDPVPDNACEGTQYGETEDYMTDIVFSIGTEELVLQKAELIVRNLGNNQFEVLMQSNNYNETLVINLHNVLGQKLVENRVEKVNGKYKYDLDMSYAKPGAYIIRLGNRQYGKVKRIIVK